MTRNPQRREVRTFEPPPWEQEQFDELARRRAEEQPEAVAPAERPEEAEAEPPGPPTPAVPEPKPPVLEERDGEAEPSDPLAGIGVEAMLLSLQSEEPAALQGAWKVALGAAVCVAALGLVLVVWGAVAMARAAGTGAVGMMGAGTISFMGMLFTAGGAWLGVRSLRQRGVL